MVSVEQRRSQNKLVHLQGGSTPHCSPVRQHHIYNRGTVIKRYEICWRWDCLLFQITWNCLKPYPSKQNTKRFYDSFYSFMAAYGGITLWLNTLLRTFYKHVVRLTPCEWKVIFKHSIKYEMIEMVHWQDDVCQAHNRCIPRFGSNTSTGIKMVIPRRKETHHST